MPVNFRDEHFSPSIIATVESISSAMFAGSRELLFENLILIEQQLQTFYLTQPQQVNPQRHAQEVYKAFLQCCLWQVCQFPKQEKNEQICQIILSHTSNLFLIDGVEQDPYHTIVWTALENEETVFDVARKGGFTELLNQLLIQASKAFGREDPDHPNQLLKNIVYITQLRKILISNLTSELLHLWGPFEQRLSYGFRDMLNSGPDVHIVNLSSKINLSEQAQLSLKRQEVTEFVQWLDAFHVEVTKLISAFRDPMTHQSLMDKIKEAPNPAFFLSDPACFMEDRELYFYSTLYQLAHDNREAPYPKSLGTGGLLMAYPIPSNTLLTLFNFSQGLGRIREHVTRCSMISIGEANHLAFNNPGYQTHIPIPSSQVAPTPLVETLPHIESIAEPHPQHPPKPAYPSLYLGNQSIFWTTHEGPSHETISNLPLAQL